MGNNIPNHILNKLNELESYTSDLVAKGIDLVLDIYDDKIDRSVLLECSKYLKGRRDNLNANKEVYFKNSEIWKPLVGYENEYDISECGKVISKDRFVNNGDNKMFVKGRLMKITPCKRTGYCSVTLSKNGSSSKLKIHRIVMKTFNPIENDEKYHVNHKDGNKLNNNVNNLDWTTPQENNSHSWEIGLQNPMRGSNHPSDKFTTFEVLEIRKRWAETKESHSRIAKDYGVGRKTISRIVNGKTYKLKNLKETEEELLERKKMIYG